MGGPQKDGMAYEVLSKISDLDRLVKENLSEKEKEREEIR